jgi:hypothetical protein
MEMSCHFQAIGEFPHGSSYQYTFDKRLGVSQNLSRGSGLEENIFPLQEIHVASLEYRMFKKRALYL